MIMDERLASFRACRPEVIQKVYQAEKNLCMSDFVQRVHCAVAIKTQLGAESGIASLFTRRFA